VPETIFIYGGYYMGKIVFGGILFLVALIIGIAGPKSQKAVLDKASYAKLAGKYTIISFIVGCVGIFIAISSCFRSVSASHTGIQVLFGKVQETTLDEGLHLTIPFTEVVQMDNRTQKKTIELSCFSKDIQEVTIIYTINYVVPSTESKQIYTKFGEDYYNNIITPAIQKTVKTYTANYTAESLVSSRAELGKKIVDDLTVNLQKNGIQLTDASIENIDFTNEFTAAVEAKQVAEQQKLQAEIEAEKLKIEAQAKADAAIITAEAEAEANKLLEESLTQQVLNKQMIEKWNGELPKVSSGSDLMLDVSQIAGQTQQ